MSTLSEHSCQPALEHCPVCGNAELFKQKAFPHWLGLSILAAACLAFMTANALYHQWLGWIILIGSALLDGGLYLWVGDAVVCYRCGAQFATSVPSNHKPFELTVAERYRQEKLRHAEISKKASR